MRGRKSAQAFARLVAREGTGKNRGPGSLFHKMCVELLPYLHMVNLCYTRPLVLISTYCEQIE